MHRKKRQSQSWLFLRNGGREIDNNLRSDENDKCFKTLKKLATIETVSPPEQRFSKNTWPDSSSTNKNQNLTSATRNNFQHKQFLKQDESSSLKIIQN